MNAKNATPDDKAPEGKVPAENAPDVAVPDAAAQNAPTDAAVADTPVVVDKPAVADRAAAAPKATEPKVTEPKAAAASEPPATAAGVPAAGAAAVAPPASETAATVPPADQVVATETQTGEVAPVATQTGEVAPVAAPQTVYVAAPQPPKVKGNRGMGVLFSVLATIVFAVVFAAVGAILVLVLGSGGLDAILVGFLSSPFFYIPVIVFLVIMIVWALLANRASWWSWVIGSLIIAVVVYFASIGALLLMAGGFGLTASAATEAFQKLAVNPALIAAALVARECAIWFGAAISRRGRKVRERNYATWQEFENEEARKKAEFGGAAAV